MGLLSGRLGLKKLAFLQERDDRFSTAFAELELWKTNSSDNRFVELFDFLFAVVAFPNEHRPGVCDDNLWIADCFQFLDPNRVILQLIVVSAELLCAAHIFLTMVLGFLQNRVELGNDFIDFPLHPIDSSVLCREASIQSLVLGCKACVNGLKYHRSLIGEELLDIFGVVLLEHGDGVNETGTATFSIGDGEKLSKECTRPVDR